MATYLTKKAHNLLALADIQVNGNRPWDIQVHDERFYGRVLSGGSLALGESYMDGWWDCEALDELISRILLADLEHLVAPSFALLASYCVAKVANLQTPSRSLVVGRVHYDIGNDLYREMLDPRLIYTCAYWKDVDTLNAAQEAKLDLICRKIGLKPGDKVLDIGCGWGGFLKYAAEKYGATGVGLTISKEQKALADELCKGLPIEIRFQDYRDTNEKFDHIVSLGMFEHVGLKNYRKYMEIAARNLKDDGFFLLHTIGVNLSKEAGEPWESKYIFPNSLVPSAKQITAAYEEFLVMEDWHNFGPYYDKTLMAWFENFDRAWPKIQRSYSERFYRMWRYYLLSCAGGFRARKLQLWQIVFSKNGVPGGYTSIR